MKDRSEKISTMKYRETRSRIKKSKRDTENTVDVYLCTRVLRKRVEEREKYQSATQVIMLNIVSGNFCFCFMCLLFIH